MYIYSKSQNTFCPLELEEEYKASGSWPHDGVGVSEDTYREFVGLPPKGKQLGSLVNGSPSWIPIQPSSYHVYDVKASQWVITKDDQLKLNSEIEAQAEAAAIQNIELLKDEAATKIKLLELAKKHNLASAEELEKLAEWEIYFVLLNKYNPKEPEQLPPRPNK